MKRIALFKSLNMAKMIVLAFKDSKETVFQRAVSFLADEF